ncbi:MAG: M15 family metallopeptidase [Treponema sp.]|jgi:D-alanyl-D-alanine carboxypeptidase|nr:M15 family metallopeptidase [Treponema sp.]
MDKEFRLYFIILFSLFFLIIIFVILINFQSEALKYEHAQETAEKAEDDHFSALVLNVLSAQRLPVQITARIQDEIARTGAESSDFINALLAILQEDPFEWILVDKENPLDKEYEPDDLVDVISGSSGERSGRMIRKAAQASLAEMMAAADSDGIRLVVLSAFRPYFYQSRIYLNLISTLGQREADRVSAKPGHSQHQLGTAIDFNLLDNRLAQTPEGVWLAANASGFGWSISYPEGFEDVTGYDWESWHYRYVGREYAMFINKYFNGIQQYANIFMQELHAELLEINPVL